MPQLRDFQLKKYSIAVYAEEAASSPPSTQACILDAIALLSL
ncbi:hypothetical protein [Tolypothrix sp. PCC 7601]|nr:hypothetical protein [Tolypothrix sp. PCC 7601]EKE99009.1 hypothetical protein FDUTEX481_03197 [Tolypothrix sp. PCC 7601]